MRTNEYRYLSQIACEILAFPVLTATIERIFTYGGETTRGKRKCLANNNLEREIFCAGISDTYSTLNYNSTSVYSIKCSSINSSLEL